MLYFANVVGMSGKTVCLCFSFDTMYAMSCGCYLSMLDLFNLWFGSHRLRRIPNSWMWGIAMNDQAHADDQLIFQLILSYLIDEPLDIEEHLK